MDDTFTLYVLKVGQSGRKRMGERNDEIAGDKNKIFVGHRDTKSRKA